ncbi:putative glycerophosphoryl diester phosphodiesterase 1 [Stieleria maiorica]|uniref:Putative glycerophosphoryl diester phosphodiesterase 1 n=1 Tax=Stieleria maiorica TaxID=2795974 RepID=A0A5B9MF75_9BACT|nr:glycerophosphodiester phosphodiesterase family protein [Stieleria maiorica]QEF98254.1 putative glycerophosphoryl diester phosphodiesterase 1 [Stieleria maiorica]
MDRLTVVVIVWVVIVWVVVAIAMDNVVPAQGPQIAPQAKQIDVEVERPLVNQHTSNPSTSPPRYRINTGTSGDLRRLLRYRNEPVPLVSAHRGGAGAGLPENCIATFEATLNHGYAMLEIDPRLSRDGVVVLHHDKTLDRTTTGSGPLSDLTLAQLKQLRLKDREGKVTDHHIPTLAEAFDWAKGKAILVLDAKDLSVAQRVKMIEQHQAEGFSMIIVGSVKQARECYELNPNIMMEVMVPDRQRLHEFEAAEIPWDNVVAFVGHDPTKDRGLIEMLHTRGVLTMAGTSRNLDRELVSAGRVDTIRARYEALLERGIDLIETDLPRQVWPMLFSETAVPESADSLRPVGRE